MRASTVCGVGSTMSSSRRWVRILELLAAFLIHVGGAVYGKPFNMRRQRDRTPNPRTRALRRIDDLLRAVV